VLRFNRWIYERCVLQQKELALTKCPAINENSVAENRMWKLLLNKNLYSAPNNNESFLTKLLMIIRLQEA
jgi:hypothetical protein